MGDSTETLILSYYLTKARLIAVAGNRPVARCHRCTIAFIGPAAEDLQGTSYAVAAVMADGRKVFLTPEDVTVTRSVGCPSCGRSIPALNSQAFRDAMGVAVAVGPDQAARQQVVRDKQRVVLEAAQAVVDGRLTVQQAAGLVEAQGDEYRPLAAWMQANAATLVVGILALLLAAVALRHADAGASQQHGDMTQLEEQIDMQDVEVRDLLRELLHRDQPSSPSAAPTPASSDARDRPKT